MEVAAGRAGDPVTDESTDAGSTRSWVSVNVFLGVAALVCSAAVYFIGDAMWEAHEGAGRDTAGGFVDDAFDVLTFQDADGAGDALSGRAGDDVGAGVVQALEPASEEEQERNAAQIDGATRMANAFLNISHENAESAVETIQSMATGPFQRQLNRVTQEMVTVARRAEATQRTNIDWVGLVYGDDDDARVIVAASGTISNRTTDFEPVARTYRLQIDLALVDGEWLTSDLQFVD